MTRTVDKPKWSLRRHTKDFDKLCIVAQTIKNYTNGSITNSDKESMQNKLRSLGLYSERNPDMPLDAIEHKIRDLAFYMFGYRDIQTKKFLFSPLGNLFLSNLEDKEKITKIFFTMLWSMQYEHPESSTETSFRLYPFRLIFELLNEHKLDKKLFSHEIAYVVMFTNKMDSDDAYKNVVKKILNLRRMSTEELANLFIADEHALVNAVYEWDYYSSKVLSSAGIITKKEGEKICTLSHPTKNQKTKATTRKVCRSLIEFPPEYLSLYNDLSSAFPLYSTPLDKNDPERLQIDAIKEIYSFYPRVLLEHLGDDSQKARDIEELLKLPRNIDRYSNNNDGREAYLFEDVLKDGFNMFYNVDANKIGGAGNTDIECLYTDKKTKFAVDAKSTKNKLSSINSGRMKNHREKIGGKYTIVVTPRYVRAVEHDIRDTKIVILRASTFSEYLYNCIQSDIRDIDYSKFDEIIENNLGTDISQHVSNLTIEQFAS